MVNYILAAWQPFDLTSQSHCANLALLLNLHDSSSLRLSYCGLQNIYQISQSSKLLTTHRTSVSLTVTDWKDYQPWLSGRKVFCGRNASGLMRGECYDEL